MRTYTCNGCGVGLVDFRLPIGWMFIIANHADGKTGVVLVCSADCVWKRARKTT